MLLKNDTMYYACSHSSNERNHEYFKDANKHLEFLEFPSQ